MSCGCGYIGGRGHGSPDPEGSSSGGENWRVTERRVVSRRLVFFGLLGSSFLGGVLMAKKKSMIGILIVAALAIGAVVFAVKKGMLKWQA